MKEEGLEIKDWTGPPGYPHIQKLADVFLLFFGGGHAHALSRRHDTSLLCS